MKKNYILIVLLFIAINIYAQTPKPEYFGAYMVINGKLIELKSANADTIRTSGTLDMGNPILGIKQKRGQWISDNNFYFLIYDDKQQGKTPTLSTLTFKATDVHTNPITHQQQQVNVNLWEFDKDIPLKTAPVTDLQNAYKYVTETPLPEGSYIFSKSGRQQSDGLFSATNNAKDVWHFTFSKSLMMDRDLSKCDIDKREYTLPSSFGFWVINNNQYVQIPATKSKDIVKYRDSTKTFPYGVTDLSGTEISQNQLAKTFIAFSDKDIRQGSTEMNLFYKIYFNMIPEKMYLSKLKQIEVDTRTDKDIKKGNPANIVKVWVEDKSIPFNNSISSFYNKQLSRVYIDQALEPGTYAFHNGRINGKDLSFGGTNIVYTFVVK